MPPKRPGDTLPPSLTHSPTAELAVMPTAAFDVMQNLSLQASPPQVLTLFELNWVRRFLYRPGATSYTTTVETIGAALARKSSEEKATFLLAQVRTFLTTISSRISDPVDQEIWTLVAPLLAIVFALHVTGRVPLTPDTWTPRATFQTDFKTALAQGLPAPYPRFATLQAAAVEAVQILTMYPNLLPAIPQHLQQSLSDVLPRQ